MGVLKSLEIIVIGIPDIEMRENMSEAKFREQTIENFQDLIKDTNSSMQKGQQIPGRKNPKKTTPRLIIVKLLKIKGKKREAFRKKKKKERTHSTCCFQRNTRGIADFSEEMMKARKKLDDFSRK